MKMKSWAAGIVGALALTLTPGVANAEDGVVKVADDVKVAGVAGSCDSWRYFTEQTWERHARYGGRIRLRLEYLAVECGNSYWDVKRSGASVFRTKRDCNLLDYIEMNPDAIGGKNLLEKTKTCEDGNRRDVARWRLGSVRVYPGDPDNEKCLGMDVDLDHRRGGLGFPDEHFDLGSVCLTMHG